jgi:type IV pilus assembly protein PilO
VRRRTLYILVGVGLVVVVLIGWVFLISPLRSSIAQKDAEILAQQQTLATAQATLARMKQTQLQAEANEGRFIELSKMLPTEDQVPSLLLQVQDLAAESGIEVMSITPSPAAPTNYGFAALGLALQFSGTYFDTNDLIYRLEQLVAAPGRLLAVKDVALTLGANLKNGVSPVLGVTMTVQAFKSIPATAPAAGG